MTLSNLGQKFYIRIQKFDTSKSIILFENYLVMNYFIYSDSFDDYVHDNDKPVAKSRQIKFFFWLIFMVVNAMKYGIMVYFNHNESRLCRG